jgi:hypothetical protein
MVLLFGVCFLLLLISAPVIVLGVGMRGAGQREPKRIKQELEQSEQEP